jgi:hypothetical protein
VLFHSSISRRLLFHPLVLYLKKEREEEEELPSTSSIVVQIQSQEEGVRKALLLPL